MYESFLNKVVVVRSVNAGVFFGTLAEIDGPTVRLSNVRNIWSWEGAACLAQLAEEGVRGGKVSQEVKELLVLDACEILLLSEVALISLNRVPAWRV